MRIWPLLIVLSLACEAKTGEPGAPRDASAGKDYRVEFSGPKVMTAGTPADCVLTVTPAAPWAVKAETPFVAVLEPDPGLKIDKPRLDAKDFIDPKTPAKAVHTACVAESKGNRTLAAKLIFFLCSHELCKRMTEQLTTTITAN